MEKTILTEYQRVVLDEVMRTPECKSFYLSGGTALAEYYFQHRLSDDLDFFTAEDPDKMFLRAFTVRLQKLIGAERVESQRIHDRNLFFLVNCKESLKLEFTKYPFPRLERLSRKKGVRVDSLRDIAVNKLVTLMDRFDPKDFVDMYFILQDRSLTQIKKDAEEKFGSKLAPLTIGSEFAKVRRIEVLPKMIVPLTVDQLKKFFMQQADVLGKTIMA